MHINKFFRNVDMLTETYAPGGVKNLLASAHPMNFLYMPINLSVYKAKIHFTAENGSYKTAEKYAVLPPSCDKNVDEWIDMYMEDYQDEKGKKLRNFGVDGIEKLGTAVLTIG